MRKNFGLNQNPEQGSFTLSYRLPGLEYCEYELQIDSPVTEMDPHHPMAVKTEQGFTVEGLKIGPVKILFDGNLEPINGKIVATKGDQKEEVDGSILLHLLLEKFGLI